MEVRAEGVERGVERGVAAHLRERQPASDQSCSSSGAIKHRPTRRAGGPSEQRSSRMCTSGTAESIRM